MDTVVNYRLRLDRLEPYVNGLFGSANVTIEVRVTRVPFVLLFLACSANADTFAGARHLLCPAHPSQAVRGEP